MKRNVNMPLHTLGVPEAEPDGRGRPKGQSFMVDHVGNKVVLDSA